MSMIYAGFFDSNADRLYDAPLMLNSLPAQLDLIRLAEEGTRLRGSLPAQPMRRLVSLCANDRTQVEIDLQFARIGTGRWEMRGAVSGSFTVICQRCLRNFELVLGCRPVVLFARSLAEERQLTEEAEQDVLLADKPVALSTLVEEELLLAFPMTPMHAVGGCAEAMASVHENTARPNPFAALAQLKKRSDSH